MKVFELVVFEKINTFQETPCQFHIIVIDYPRESLLETEEKRANGIYSSCEIRILLSQESYNFFVL